MSYKITFEFKDEYGGTVKDYLNRNGKGFSYEDAVEIARQLREHGNENVTVVANGCCNG